MTSEEYAEKYKYQMIKDKRIKIEYERIKRREKEERVRQKELKDRFEREQKKK